MEYYVPLARSLRPQSFSDMVGQKTTIEALRFMIQTQRIHPALIFTGARGTGKTSTARIIAKCLCCTEGIVEEPCQKCQHCEKIKTFSHEDVVEMDGATATGVDAIRSLKEQIQLYPQSARYRIFIIDEVHMLSISAFNALLKTIEEPPPFTVFILATTEVHKIPATIRSRCLMFSFGSLAHEDLMGLVKDALRTKNLNWEEEALALLVHKALGSARDALSLLEQVIPFIQTDCMDRKAVTQGLRLSDPQNVKEMVLSLVNGDIQKSQSLLLQLHENHENLHEFFKSVFEYFQQIMISIDYYSHLDKEVLIYIKNHLNIPVLSAVVQRLLQILEDIQQSQDPLPWCQLGILDIIHRRDWLSSGEVLSLLKKSSQNPKDMPQKVTPLVQQPEDIHKKFSQTIQTLQKNHPILGTKLKNIPIISLNTQGITFQGEGSLYHDLSTQEWEILMMRLKKDFSESFEVHGLKKKSSINL